MELANQKVRVRCCLDRGVMRLPWLQVESVEGEMRELLQEVAAERKSMETKFAQLSTVVLDLQKDFAA